MNSIKMTMDDRMDLIDGISDHAYELCKCFAEAAAHYFAAVEGLSCIAVRIGSFESRWLERYPNARIYGETEAGGLGVIMVLPDEPEKLNLPPNPDVSLALNTWQKLVQPASLGLTGLLKASRGVVQDVAPRGNEPAVMRELAQLGEDAYRDLIDRTPGILDYFYEATPVNEIGMMNIGSRPSHRKKDRSKASIRAIPWVFSWMQSRAISPPRSTSSSDMNSPPSLHLAMKPNSSSSSASCLESVCRQLSRSPPMETDFQQAISASRFSTSKRMRISCIRS